MCFTELASCLCSLVTASLRAPVVCHRTNMEDNQCQQVLLIGCQAAVTAYSSANSIVLQLISSANTAELYCNSVTRCQQQLRYTQTTTLLVVCTAESANCGASAHTQVA
jgi:hypothetical protein